MLATPISDWRKYLHLVDHHDLTILTVRTLRAIQPDGVGVIDLDTEHLAGLLFTVLGVDREETGEDGIVSSATEEGLTWLVIAGLSDGVIVWVEFEIDSIANFCFDVVWIDVQAIVADPDGVRGISNGQGGPEKGLPGGIG